MTSPDPNYIRSRELLARDDSRVLIVDVQREIHGPQPPDASGMIGNCRRLIRGAEETAGSPDQHDRTVSATASARRCPNWPSSPRPPVKQVRFSGAECLDWVTGDRGDRVKVVVTASRRPRLYSADVLDLLPPGSAYISRPTPSPVATRSIATLPCDRLRDSGAERLRRPNPFSSNGAKPPPRRSSSRSA